MWYLYVFPRKIEYNYRRHWRWLNTIFVPAVHKDELVWKHTGGGNYTSQLPNGCIYDIGPAECIGLYVAVGNGLPITYRRTLAEAKLACETHRKTV